MQLLSVHKKLSLSLVVLLACSITTSSLYAEAAPAAAEPPHPLKTITTQKAATISILVLAIASYLWLKIKKTQPKCVYPQWEKNDSPANMFKNVMKCIWFTFDEICTGQSAKGERPSKIHFNPEDPYEGIYEYSKIEPRGIAGNLEALLKPAIIPAFTLMVLFNTDFKKKIQEAIVDTLKFIDNPMSWFDELKDVYDHVKLPNTAAPATTATK
jgi:hypothetical protein